MQIWWVPSKMEVWLIWFHFRTLVYSRCTCFAADSRSHWNLFTHPHFSNSHKQDVEICSGTIFTQKTCCKIHLHQISPMGEIYHKSSDQIWAHLPGNGSQRTSQHWRLGLTHYGACLMTDNTSSRSKVANSFTHSGYISWLHTYPGLSGHLTSRGPAEECQRAKCDIVAETIPRVDHGGALLE